MAGKEVNKGRRSTSQNLTPATERGAQPMSEEDKDDAYPFIHHLILQGLNDSEIAKQVGIDRKAVAHIRKTSIAPRKDHLGRIQRGSERDLVDTEILRLFGMGMTWLEIAEQVNLSWTTVRSRLRGQMATLLQERREEVGGRQVADMEVLKTELWSIIIKDHEEEMLESLHEIEQGENMDKRHQGQDWLEQAYEKGKKNQDARFKAMEILLKIYDGERKLFKLDDKNVNVNVSHEVKPEAIELLGLIKNRQVDNVLEAEIVDDFELGSM